MLDYNEVKKHFADKLAGDGDGMGRFESAFYRTIEMAYLKGVADGKESTLNPEPDQDDVVGITDHK